MAKILVADDSLAELQIITQTLQSTGHNIVTSWTGRLPRQRRSREVRLIILDVIMPKKNGFQCAVRSRPTNRQEHPVIMVTSKDQESDKFWE